MTRNSALAAVLVISAVLLGIAPARSQQPDSGHFLRVLKNQAGIVVAMQSSVLALKAPAPQGGDFSVDLISAVHVADRGYYDEINRRFQNYEAVLFELIAPRDINQQPGFNEGIKSEESGISAVQLAITRMLNVEFQLRAIDYGAPNLVHADMSPEEFAESMRQRNESFTRLFLRVFGLAQLKGLQPKDSPPDLASLLLIASGSSRALALKRLMAPEFTEMESISLMVDSSGPGGSTLVGQRNRVALEVLSRELKSGKRKFAIFYGAAHMPDIERRLIDTYSAKVTSLSWLTAWDMQDSAQP